MYRLAIKSTEKRIKEIESVSFFRQSGVHWSCYILLVTNFMNYCLSRSMAIGHASVDRVWVRSQTLPLESDRAYQPFVNL